MLQDLRYCFRTLRKNPGLVSVAVVSLALGLGLNLTVFGVFESLFLRGVTAEDPNHTFHVWMGGSNRTSYPNYRDLRDSKAAQRLGAYSLMEFAFGDGESREKKFGQVVTGDYFEMLGVTPYLGRGFSSDEKEPERNAQVALLSYPFWLRHFNADRTVLGQNLRLNGKAFTIVGVLPDGYRSVHGFAMEPPFYVPYSGAVDPNYRDRSGHALELVMRTAPGQTREQASAALLSAAKELERLYPKENLRYGQVKVFGVAGAEVLAGQGGARMALLFFAILSVLVGLILLIACANVAGLLIARAVSRRREIAVRLAVGASSRRLVRLFLTEGMVLATFGLTAASVLYLWAVQALGYVNLPMEVPFYIRPELNWRVALYCAALAIGTAILCSVGPALEAARANVSSGLKNQIASSARGRLFSFRNVLVIGQVAVSLLLLVTSLLFIRSLRAVQTVDPGFNVDNQMIANVRLDDARKGVTTTDDILDRLGKVPGVQSVSAAVIVPLSQHIWITSVKIDHDASRQVQVQANAVASHYFRTVGVRMLAGRDFADRDNASSPQVAIVNAAFVSQHLRGRSGVGSVLTMSKGPGEEETFEIVGVVADSKHISLGEDPTPVLYRPLKQEDFPLPPGIQIRTSGPAAAMVSVVRDTLRDLAPNAIVDVKTMRENIELSTYPNRIGAALLGGLGVLGLVLASVGLYGVLAYAVGRRVREIGVRMALGASRGQVLRVVLADAMALLGIGVGVGLALSLIATRPLSSFLASGVSVTDPLTLATVVCALAMTAGAAAFVPARRAMRVDPMAALRQE